MTIVMIAPIPIIIERIIIRFVCVLEFWISSVVFDVGWVDDVGRTNVVVFSEDSVVFEVVIIVVGVIVVDLVVELVVVVEVRTWYNIQSFILTYPQSAK